MADNINMNDNDNNNSTNTNTNTTDVNIFAPPLPVIEDKKAITLKCKVNELCGWLQAMVEVMPIVDDKTLLEKEEWCQQWKHLIDSLTTCIQLAHQTKVHIHLTDAERQNGQSGNNICNTFQGQSNLQAKQECQAQAEKDDAGTMQDHTQEGDPQSDDSHKDNTKANDKLVSPKNIIVCKNLKKIIANAIPCTKCIRIGCMCYPTSVSNVCTDCKHLKVKCSLASRQGVANPTSQSHHCQALAEANHKAKAGVAHKVAAPISVAKAKGQAKEKDVPTAGSTPQCTAPGLLRALCPYVETKVVHKRKYVEVEEESSESKSKGDNEDEDTYMAGRLNGLNTFVNMFKIAFGALKKEVVEIDSYLGKKHYHHHK
ncbi:hypothetical protein BD769DRAFT_1667382 [Suillus cothurnatus]|nr:hypothetical protein BD769DRAFT_1667382 [Suillus cothurnatus]